VVSLIEHGAECQTADVLGKALHEACLAAGK
jgi:hypothetical protein